MNESKILRIIDVNLNRATEGLRVVEEICRFILEDKELTLAVKKLRNSLFKVEKACEGPLRDRGLKARKALEDVGRELYTRDEGRRTSVESIFRANMKRAQEAVRCLEEFSKLINPRFGKAYKNIRFKLYELEKQLAPRIAKAIKLDFDFYVVTDPKFGHLKMLRQAIASKVKIVQFRDKKATKQQYLSLARKMAAIARKAGVTFILNDHWDLVEKVGADGVHLGQKDLPIRQARKKLGEDKIIGVSVQTLAQARKAQKEGADYVAVSPVFSTPMKPEAKAVGLKVLAKIVKYLKIPVVAIGGINSDNISSVKKTGCRRFALIRAAADLSEF